MANRTVGLSLAPATVLDLEAREVGVVLLFLDKGHLEMFLASPGHRRRHPSRSPRISPVETQQRTQGHGCDGVAASDSAEDRTLTSLRGAFGLICASSVVSALFKKSGEL